LAEKLWSLPDTLAFRLDSQRRPETPRSHFKTGQHSATNFLDPDPLLNLNAECAIYRICRHGAGRRSEPAVCRGYPVEHLRAAVFAKKAL